VVLPKPVCSCVFVLAVTLFSTPAAKAQDRRKPAIEQSLRAAIAVEQAAPKAQRNLFSGALNNWLSLAHSLLDQQVVTPDSAGRSRLPGDSFSAGPFGSAGFRSGRGGESEERNDVEQVSSTKSDLQFSQLAGFTQSTTSTAWCGHNVVTGFNSTNATVQTFLVPSFNGQIFEAISSVSAAFSRDDGESFTDIGFLPPGPFPNGLGGNPVLVCTDPKTFYFASSPFATGTADLQNFTVNPMAGVAVSASHNGGAHWSDPTAAVEKGFFHLIDKAWLAVDQHSPNRLYVTYTDFDEDGLFNHPTARCPGNPRSATELVTSTDGGNTWSLPVIVREDCHHVDPKTQAFVGNSSTGSQVAVGRNGRVYISYLLFAEDGSIHVKFVSSEDHGATFSTEVNAADVTQAGCCEAIDGLFGFLQGFLQGIFHNLSFPAMAVDTHGSHDRIYIVWDDGRNNSQIDLVAAGQTYNFSDILITKSTDGGRHWTDPKTVSPTPDDFAGTGRDQFQPGIAVNDDGRVAVCYADRRNDPANNAVDEFCSFSNDHGETFRDIRQTTSSWVPVHAAESTLLTDPTYLGDYDTVAAHRGGGEDDGFFSGFQVIKNVIPSAHGRSNNREE